MFDYIVPLLLFVCCAIALGKRENAYDLMLLGAADGLKLLLSIVPTLVLLLTAVTMLRSSGAMELLTAWLAPLFRFVGIPPETAMLVLIRPISGSAAMAVAADLMSTYGVDSIIGVRWEQSLAMFRGELADRFKPSDRDCRVQGAVFEINAQGKCTGVRRVEIS